ncbi:MAG: alpha/beta hydrolase [Granulosicoccus sp.]|nr:alpha/beta hydrolase [Granulosicoccus sp.]
MACYHRHPDFQEQASEAIKQGVNTDPNNTNATEQVVNVSSGKVNLEGTLCLPAAPVSHSVLMLPDSGPMDRNQNSAQAQLNIFNSIANHLADHGIASLRFDKRGCGKSKGDFNKTGHSDLVADAKSWLDFMQTQSAISDSRLFVLGHGEGTLISPQLIKFDDRIAGQILLMPFAENYETIIRRQAENGLLDIQNMEGFRGSLLRFFLKLSGDQLAKQKKLIARIRKSKRSTIKIRKQVINAKWIREMVSCNPIHIHSNVSKPTLLIGGAKDLQCRSEDVNTIAALLQGPVEQHIFSDLTHILRADPEQPSIRHYLTLSLLDLDGRVLNCITNWLHQQSE